MSTSATADSIAVANPGPTTQELWRRYHKRSDSDVENALIVKYLPLVSSIAARLAMNLPEHVAQDDLYSSGLVGLLQAVRNYDPACGASFETYARTRIRGAMLDELRKMDWVPRTIHEKARKVQDVMARLEQKLGEAPTEAQMAAAMKLSMSEYGKLLDQIRPVAFVCLDTVSSENDTGDLYEVVANTAEESPLEQISRQELKKVILARLKEMPDVPRKVLALYYGEGLHLREIAEAIGLTESRICQIHAQAILSIRVYLQRFEAGLVKQHGTINSS
ncbi:MAG TPA: FliA/WhiG family RNA polymerase sigma factor [Verrucomicrobiae bacterium]|nr:FliA/WhiG family RNA polymerase sigma factor [Verrucomicrobiae bacterium]